MHCVVQTNLERTFSFVGILSLFLLLLLVFYLSYIRATHPVKVNTFVIISENESIHVSCMTKE